MEGQTRDPGPIDPDPQREETAAPTRRQVEDEIRNGVLAIHRDSYGGAARDARAHLMDDTVIVILDHLELLPNERFLIEHGRVDAVKDLREEFQQAIRSTFTAAVERATGRRVVGFTSHVQLDDEPSFSVEIFRLGPRGE